MSALNVITNGTGNGIATVCAFLSSSDCAPVSPFHQARGDESIMRKKQYPQTMFDGEEHFNDRAYQLFSLQITDWLHRSTLPDEGVTDEMIKNAMVYWNDIFFNKHCESPIEELLAAALLFSTNGYNYNHLLPYELIEAMHDGDIEKAISGEMISTVIPQVPIDNLRVDFLIVTKIREQYLKVIVECDGHDFHEKSKQQASKDKKRDRQVSALGIPVFRFTGSDIYYKPFACAEEISSYLYNQIEDILMPGRRKK